MDDLLLYCGDVNVREITDTYGPTPYGGGYCGGVILIGTALDGAVSRVVWDPGVSYSRGPDLPDECRPAWASIVYGGGAVLWG